MRTTIRVAVVTTLALAMLAPGMPAQAQTPADVLFARLNGAREVPGPGDPDGRGRAVVIPRPKEHRLCYVITARDITLPAAAAHIHAGTKDVAGPIAIALTPPDEDGVSAECLGDLDRALLRAIKNHPRQYYVNVHTSDFPDGAIRGQLHVI